MNHIAEDFKHGSNLNLGFEVIIEPDVVVGNNVKIGHRATLKSGTRMADNSILDDHCITTGVCYIGKNVNIRTGAIVSKSTIIEDNVFIGPGVITNHTKHVWHAREGQVPKEQLLSYFGYGSIIGSQASILAGVFIGPQSIIGGGSVVVKNVAGHAVYVGSPCRKLSDLPPGYLIDQPDDAGNTYRTEEILDLFRRYLPDLRMDLI